MKARAIAFSAIILGTACALTVWLFFQRQATAPENNQRQANLTARTISKVVQPRAVAAVSGSAPATNRAPHPANSESHSDTAAQNLSPNASAASAAGETLKDPVAREALSLVGLDPEAEAYWLAAINDLSLPANERQDLIEDLNEEGLADPRHPTPDDLPLILNRIALIESIGPDAADEVNADAFIEAYKDLLNLAELAMGGGEPVK